MHLSTTRMPLRTTSDCWILPAMWQPTSSNPTLKMSTSKVHTWRMAAWSMPAKHSRTSMPPARQASGACPCHVVTAAWTCLTPFSLWLQKSSQQPMQVSRTSGHSRVVSTPSMSSVLRNSVRSTSLAFAQARPWVWTWQSQMQVPTCSAWCWRPHRMRTAHGVSTVWSVSSPMETPTSTWYWHVQRKAPRTVVVFQCSSTTSVMAA